MSQSQPPLDALDRRILLRYQRDTRATAESIAAAVGLSTAAVQRRLRRMRESGVIQREIALIDARAVGLAITCIVAVELLRETGRGIERFKSKVAKFPEVQQCYYVTGTCDFMVVVLSPDMQAYEAFTHKAFVDDPNVRSFTTHVVLDAVKVGAEVPIPRARD
ncbi:MAG TPA: Lrp/AsnC family transcriptional regulator [Steroidobacteraceae bacterium]|nr:Lrp/AsnC family transcriptional regulator [Steroidobacteraceae bacterium]